MKSNLELQKDVQNELKRQPNLIDTELKISVENGVVTLIGIVDSLLKKDTAVEAVKQISGVKNVVDKLDVKAIKSADITKSTFGNEENILSPTEGPLKISGA